MKRRIENLTRELQELELIKERIVKNKLKTERPKIGLVLSGGGAKGAAHIGVIRVLEEYNIPIDYVVGTSFGSIVGSLYCAGYTPQELEKIILEMNWNSFRGDNLNRKDTPIFSKFQTEKYFLSLGLDEEYNLKFPKGVLNGKDFYLKLKELLWRTEGLKTFDDLPIPFRAVSTNLNTGEVYMPSEGDLAKAVFMSMSIPSILDPVEEDGNYYVDGGVVENLPVQQMMDMGADIIIAVDITADAIEIEEDSTLVEVLNKMSTYRSVEHFQKAKKAADILIIPDVKDHGTADFTELPVLVEKGEEEAREHAQDLIKLSVEDPDRKISLVEKKMHIQEIQLRGNKNTTKKMILDFSPKKLPGEFTKEELLQWMKKVSVQSDINRLFYRIKDNILMVEVQETETTHLRAGLNYSSDFGAALGIAADFKTYSFFRGDNLIHGELSKYPKLWLMSTKSYRLGELQYVGAASIGLSTDPLFIYDMEDKIGEYKSYNFNAGITLGTILFNSHLMAGELKVINAQNKYSSGTKGFEPKSSWDYYKGRVFLVGDSKDAPYFPSRGGAYILNFFNGNDFNDSDKANFYGSTFQFERYGILTKELKLGFFVAGGRIAGDSIPENEYLKLGGLRNRFETNQFAFYGMNAMRKYTDEFYMTGLEFRYMLENNISLNLRYNIGTYGDTQMSKIKGERTIWTDRYHGVGIGIGWNTIIGPMEFVLSNDVDASGPLFLLFLGYDF